MPQKNTSTGRLAYKLYNKIGATILDKARAKALINAESPENLDVYGRFVCAEIAFWSRFTTEQTRQETFEAFQRIVLDKQSPKPLIVGACFFLGRCYELGFGTDYNKSMAYAHYRSANKLNPKACLKDIARLQKLTNTKQKITDTSTPGKFSYRDDLTTFDESEYEDSLKEWAEEFENCKRSLADSGFFYADDPDEVDVDLYDVTGNNYKK